MKCNRYIAETIQGNRWEHLLFEDGTLYETYFNPSYDIIKQNVSNLSPDKVLSFSKKHEQDLIEIYDTNKPTT